MTVSGNALYTRSANARICAVARALSLNWIDRILIWVCGGSHMTAMHVKAGRRVVGGGGVGVGNCETAPLAVESTSEHALE